MSNEKELVLFCRADGKWAVYDDTYDITIHCESQQEQDDTMKMLEKANEYRDFSVTGMLDEYVPKYPIASATALSRFCKTFQIKHKHSCIACPFSAPVKGGDGWQCKLSVPSSWDV